MKSSKEIRTEFCGMTILTRVSDSLPANTEDIKRIVNKTIELQIRAMADHIMYLGIAQMLKEKDKFK